MRLEGQPTELEVTTIDELLVETEGGTVLDEALLTVTDTIEEELGTTDIESAPGLYLSRS